MTVQHEPARTELSGIRTLWAQVPGDARGFLVFGVGQRDLPPELTGLHHLVEHLVMRRVGRVATEHNASSSPDSMVFYAASCDEDVSDFLRRVGDAVAGLATVTEEEVAAERATIVTEIGAEGVYATADGFSHRWGPTGLGAIDLGHAALPALTAADVHAFAAHWLTTGNARLVFSTRPPEGLSAAVPPGPVPARTPEPAPLPGPTPAFAVGTGETLGLSFLVDAPVQRRQLAATVLEEAMTRRLRLERGLVYAVELVALWTGPESAHWSLMLDPQDTAVDETVLLARQVLADLVAHGPDQELLDHARATLRARLRSTDTALTALITTAENELRGWPTPTTADLLAALEIGTADQVREVLGGIAGTLLLVVPGRVGLLPETEEALEGLGLTPRPGLSHYRGMSTKEIRADLVTDGNPDGPGSLFDVRTSIHRGKFWSPWRGIDLAIGRNQLVLIDIAARIRVEDIALVGRDDDGAWEVVTWQGGVVSIVTGGFRGAQKPWDRFVAGLPDRVIRHKTGFPARPAAD
ncbi:M16 family metallopeptidase [Cellulomonas denverensis]|uniref:M16 family metallopeptidase n=1 Tax=Cellulomonas denverensis TaxID=264297 RepID=UPI0035ED8594